MRLVEEKGKVKEETQEGLPPPPLSVVHVVEDRIPHLGLDVSAIIFIQSLAGAAISGFHLESFPDLQVIGQFPLVFLLHCFYDFGFSLVYFFLAVFFVLRDTGVAPIPCSGGSTVLLSSCGNGMDGLSDVFCLN